MGYKRKWLQATDLQVHDPTGAVLVRSIESSAQEDFELLAFPIWHVEGIEDVTWDVQFAIAALDDPTFASPLLEGDTSVDYAGLYARIDYCGVPGEITPLTDGGIATKLSEVDSNRRSGELLVPLASEPLALLIPGKKYIRRSRQKARGHDEWSVYHDEIILW